MKLYIVSRKLVKFKDVTIGKLFRAPHGSAVFIKGFDGTAAYNSQQLNVEDGGIDFDEDDQVEVAVDVQVSF